MQIHSNVKMIRQVSRSYHLRNKNQHFQLLEHLISTDLNKHETPALNNIASAEGACTAEYGFTADTLKPKYYNIKRIFGKIILVEYKIQMT